MKKHESRLSRDILLEQMRRLACAKVNDAVKLAYLPEEERESIGRLDLAALTEFRRSGAGTVELKFTDRVTLNGMTLMNWEAFNIPMSSEYVSNLKESDTVRPGMFFKTTLQLDKAGDCYIDLKDFTKGLVYVNGHNLGRFWNVGPQYRLYCPGVWLKEGTNEIIIFDMHQTEPGVIQGVETLE